MKYYEFCKSQNCKWLEYAVISDFVPSVHVCRYKYKGEDRGGVVEEELSDCPDSIINFCEHYEAFNTVLDLIRL